MKLSVLTTLRYIERVSVPIELEPASLKHPCKLIPQLSKCKDKISRPGSPESNAPTLCYWPARDRNGASPAALHLQSHRS